MFHFTVSYCCESYVDFYRLSFLINSVSKAMVYVLGSLLSQILCIHQGLGMFPIR